jgi:outer membrane protein W
MKKLSLMLALVAFQAVCFAQNFSVGPIVGLNISNLRGDVTNNSAKLGLAAGAFANYSITDNFGFTGQLLYSQQGAKTKVGTNDDAVKLDYLQIPILAVYYLGQGNFRPKLLLGPQFGFLLSAKDKAGKDQDPNNVILEKNDLGIVVGAGFNYNLSSKIWLNADVRYDYGLTDIFKDVNIKGYNTNFALMVGVSFGFKDYDMKTGAFTSPKKGK